MSSLTKEKSGTWRIKFLDGYKSKGIRLGACDKKTAQATQLYVDRLIAAKRLGTPLDSETIGLAEPVGFHHTRPYCQGRIDHKSPRHQGPNTSGTHGPL